MLQHRHKRRCWIWMAASSIMTVFEILIQEILFTAAAARVNKICRQILLDRPGSQVNKIFDIPSPKMTIRSGKSCARSLATGKTRNLVLDIRFQEEQDFLYFDHGSAQFKNKTLPLQDRQI
jgi:hypothetical protein